MLQALLGQRRILLQILLAIAPSLPPLALQPSKIPEVKYERILLENLKDDDTRERLNARLSDAIGPFRAREELHGM